MKKSLALVASETRAAFRKKRGDASVHMYSFNKAAVVFLDIQERLNNDWFVLTALLSLVHQPHILASFNFFLFFFYISFFFLKKEATKSLTSFPHLLLRDEDHLPSILYITPLHPHCTSSVPLPHCRPNSPSSRSNSHTAQTYRNSKYNPKRAKGKCPLESSAA